MVAEQLLALPVVVSVVVLQIEHDAVFLEPREGSCRVATVRAIPSC